MWIKKSFKIRWSQFAILRQSSLCIMGKKLFEVGDLGHASISIFSYTFVTHVSFQINY